MRPSATVFGFCLLFAVAGSASAALRVPQVPVAGGTLQGYLNGQGETINVLTDQNAAQRWTATIANHSTFTIQVELSANAAANSIGLYNAGLPSPPLYQVFPGAATAGWFAVAVFTSTPSLVVTLFDPTATPQGTVTYLAGPPSKTNFGFYLDGPAGVFYSQDALNPGGNPQALTFGGTGLNAGSWWLCFEDTPFTAGTSDFDDAVLFLEFVNPTPVHKSSWGDLKARFR